VEYYYTKKNHNQNSRENSPLKLKVCGMNENTTEVAALKPDYLGFIFWKPSKRSFNGIMPHVPHSVKKVGVFVDADVDEIKSLALEYGLLLAQLHGKESPAFCEALKKAVPHLKIIKVFSIKDSFDFKELTPFEGVCDYYLFDTKGKLPGGNGYTFDWSLLKNYPSKKPYFLSGGIGLDELASINAFIKRPESQYCHAIDVNSKFEIEPGLKEVGKLEEFKKRISN